jgi:hypothetical protein
MAQHAPGSCCLPWGGRRWREKRRGPRRILTSLRLRGLTRRLLTPTQDPQFDVRHSSPADVLPWRAPLIVCDER